MPDPYTHTIAWIQELERARGFALEDLISLVRMRHHHLSHDGAYRLILEARQQEGRV